MVKEETEVYDYEEDSPKKGSAQKMKNYYILGGLLVLFIISFSLFFYPASDKITEVDNETLLMCGDGTFYADCSLNRPYYCEDGELIYNPKDCGCPASLIKRDGKCDNKYFTPEKNVVLKYFLDGVEKHINITTYEDVSEYLDERERTITYSVDEIPQRSDFKLNKINDEIQRESLMELVVKIQNLAPNSPVDQARIATSIVQNIEYKESEFGNVGNFKVANIRLARYPYQVIEGGVGSCEGKSELLVFLLRELGYGTSVFYYNAENHEAVGIKCPVEESLQGSGYCFIETTVPSPISYSTGNYLIGDAPGKGLGTPKIVILNKGISLPENMIEYDDVRKIEKALDNKRTDIFERAVVLNPIYKKYGMNLD